ncbi:MAG TPA: carboxylating nicotinate-nucleotide diphosphorylase [Desulfosalsimonadaceae bacterium]|nr:carboxylating nicotinate-nucleotide diphosphorylase [Desulfosalsimonadaceae bacterium]
MDQLIELAIIEDIGPADITSAALPQVPLKGEATIIAKEPVIIAGLGTARRVFERIDPKVCFCALSSDGDAASVGQEIVQIVGDFRSLLMAERIALNFLQRLCGIATHVRTFVGEIAGSSVRLVDTRKTIPGWRELEKYAVRMGGANNHRMGLYDGILIKDNHIAAFGDIRAAVSAARQTASHLLKIEIEVTGLDQVREALAAGADVIMLDNMNEADIRQAVSEINGRALVEVSGQVARGELKSLADMGVDIISVGALIHAARFVDLSMRIQLKESV